MFRPKALSDLDDIWDHTVERWSAAQAGRYLSALNDAFGLLCNHPEIAREHPFTPPVRVFPYRFHLLIFTTDGTTVEVIRILHMRSDWQVLLAE